MKLDRLTAAQLFPIKAPRYHDRTVRLINYKIGNHNIITIETGTSKGDWYVSGNTARLYPITKMITKTGNTVDMRDVPLDELQLYEGRQ